MCTLQKQTRYYIVSNLNHRKMYVRKLLMVISGFVITADSGTPNPATPISAYPNLSLIVPLAVRRLTTVILQCKYDLPEGTLYAIKWYKDNMEFFRYRPKEKPSTLLFNTPGVNLDLDKSNYNQIVLVNVQRNATGFYTCEVSTDAPFFHTSVDTAFMYVVDVPEKAPTVVSKTRSFKIITVCTSPPSDPPMNITWLVNNETIYKGLDIHIPATTNVTDSHPQSTQSILELSTDNSTNLFKNGRVKIRCVANLFHLYQGEVEFVALQTKMNDAYAQVLQKQITPYYTRKELFLWPVNFIIYFSVVAIVMGVLYGYVWYKS